MRVSEVSRRLDKPGFGRQTIIEAGAYLTANVTAQMCGLKAIHRHATSGSSHSRSSQTRQSSIQSVTNPGCTSTDSLQRAFQRDSVINHAGQAREAYFSVKFLVSSCRIDLALATRNFQLETPWQTEMLTAEPVPTANNYFVGEGLPLRNR